MFSCETGSVFARSQKFSLSIIIMNYFALFIGFYLACLVLFLYFCVVHLRHSESIWLCSRDPIAPILYSKWPMVPIVWPIQTDFGWFALGRMTLSCNPKPNKATVRKWMKTMMILKNMLTIDFDCSAFSRPFADTFFPMIARKKVLFFHRTERNGFVCFSLFSRQPEVIRPLSSLVFVNANEMQTNQCLTTIWPTANRSVVNRGNFLCTWFIFSLRMTFFACKTHTFSMWTNLTGRFILKKEACAFQWCRHFLFKPFLWSNDQLCDLRSFH